jgi:SAM-dependent methyltransferase
MRAEAHRRAGSAGSTARFVDGDAAALPIEAGSVDIVMCERVFQHLDQPDRAATEIGRVLGDAGRAVVIDMDWGSAILHPGAPALAQSAIDALCARNTNPRAGRRLAGHLAQAGLTVRDMHARALVIWNPATGGWTLVTHMVTEARDSGLLTADQYTQLMADLTAGAERGDFLLSVTMYAVLAHKQ